mmetsp:Transcript_4589/g.10886  ORF Transcript_4589/g.10886 Transcript_4589/m.10886 type:complete len:699 (-) Transcript_4589:359-2455(-)
MGNGSSNLMVKGVPMPPTAWALASMWNSVWEAPRVQAGGGALKREEITPLLKIAASCVATLLPHITSQDKKTQLPPYGASRELLVAAVDGAPAGRSLPKPADDPQGFVLELTRAAFTTGDGDLMHGLTQERFDALMKEHCSTQLEQAGRLLKDSTSALEAALEAAKGRVKEIVASPPEASNLAGVADRLLLAQRLQRLADDAAVLLQTEAAAKEAAEELKRSDADQMEVDELHNTAEEVTSEEALTRTASTAFGDSQSPEGSPEGQPDDQKMDVDQIQEEEEEEETTPDFQRTKSQVAASVKVQKVKKHLDESKDTIHDLGRTVSHLAKKGVPEDDSVATLKAELEAVDQARKRARNFGEDLLEDMLALDGLHNLDPQDRSERKASIAGIEALLQDVDAAKTRLNTLYSNIKGKLEAAQAAQQKKKQEQEQEQQQQQQQVQEVQSARSTPSAPMAELAQPAPQSARAPRAVAGKGNGPKRMAVDGALLAPLPEREDWRQLRLPLRFHSREENDQYVILASVPGLDIDDLKLELGEDSASLSVQGLKAPSDQEAKRMQKKISARLTALAQQSPKHFAKIRDHLDEVVKEAYAELGQDEYGRFSETFRLPEDVDADRIDASYQDGVLRVTLPKIPPRRRSPMMAADPYDALRGARYASGAPRRQAVGGPGYGGYRGYGYPPAAAGGFPGLFGGRDDSYFW